MSLVIYISRGILDTELLLIKGSRGENKMKMFLRLIKFCFRSLYNVYQPTKARSPIHPRARLFLTAILFFTICSESQAQRSCPGKSKVRFKKDAQVYMSPTAGASFMPMVRKGTEHGIATGSCLNSSVDRNNRVWISYRRNVGGSVLHFVLADSVEVIGSTILAAQADTEY